jgi:2-iminobutanoate/2-iminopropanoate deaminase
VSETVERVPSTFASFSDAVAVEGPGRWIHVAGQIATDESGHVSGGLAEQTSVTLDNIERVLGRVEADLSHVVKITVYLTSLDDYAEFSRVRGERFGETLPASAAVQVAGLLLGALIEIEAVAFVPAR